MFSISVATVIGPTPPGTGVIHEARSAAGANSTSPTRRPSSSAVDADVDDDRARLDPLALDQFGLARRDDDDVGAAHFAFEIAREAVACRGRAAGQQELEHERPADMVGNADDDRLLPAHRPIRVCEQRHHAFRRARPQSALAQREATDVDRLETVDVLVRDRCDR